MRKIRIIVDTGYPSAQIVDECDLPNNWDNMTDDEQQQFFTECEETSISNHITAYAEMVGDE